MGVPPRVLMIGAGKPAYAGEPTGYATSAAYGYTFGASIARAWLPAELACAGTRVEVEHFRTRFPPRSPRSRCSTPP